jgi:hypothetical protein
MLHGSDSGLISPDSWIMLSIMIQMMISVVISIMIVPPNSHPCISRCYVWTSWNDSWLRSLGRLGAQMKSDWHYLAIKQWRFYGKVLLECDIIESNPQQGYFDQGSNSTKKDIYRTSPWMIKGQARSRDMPFKILGTSHLLERCLSRVRVTRGFEGTLCSSGATSTLSKIFGQSVSAWRKTWCPCVCKPPS